MEDAAGSWLVRLEESGAAEAVRGSAWAYPAVEVLHILGFVVLAGAAAMFDLRLLGAARSLPVSGVARYLLPWSQASVAVVVPTGLLLFVTEATTLVESTPFRLKLILIGLAGLNALLFHRLTLPTVGTWDRGTKAPARARAAAVLSLLLWTGVITCGRFIAYF